jgi:hypothetical protein
VDVRDAIAVASTIIETSGHGAAALGSAIEDMLVGVGGARPRDRNDDCPRPASRRSHGRARGVAALALI